MTDVSQRQHNFPMLNCIKLMKHVHKKRSFTKLTRMPLPSYSMPFSKKCNKIWPLSTYRFPFSQCPIVSKKKNRFSKCVLCRINNPPIVHRDGLVEKGPTKHTTTKSWARYNVENSHTSFCHLHIAMLIFSTWHQTKIIVIINLLTIYLGFTGH